MAAGLLPGSLQVALAFIGLRPAVSPVKRLCRVRCNPAHRVGQKLPLLPPRLREEALLMDLNLFIP